MNGNAGQSFLLHNLSPTGIRRNAGFLVYAEEIFNLSHPRKPWEFTVKFVWGELDMGHNDVGFGEGK